MEIESREVWIGTHKQWVGIKKFSQNELSDKLMKFPLGTFVYETKYVSRIVNLCWVNNGVFPKQKTVSYGDILSVYKSILEVNPFLKFENYQINLPGTKKRIERNEIVRAEQNKEENLKGVSLEEIISFIDFEELESYLNREVIGQREATRQLSGELINRKHMGVSEEGCEVDYLFGPSGVGKTSSIKSLAKYLGVPLVHIQGSEYMEETDCRKLFGSPPSYVGYDDEGGRLQKAIKKNSDSIILFDEIDKAHFKVISSLTSFFGDRFLTIPNGEKVFFNGLIYLTSNTGNKLSESVMGREIGFEKDEKSNSESEKKRILSILKQQGIGSEFLGRINNFISFARLSNLDLAKILNKNINEVNERLKYYKIDLTDEAKKEVLERGDTNSFGAREIRHNLDRVIISPMNYEYEMNRSIPNSSIVSVDFENGRFTHSIKDKSLLLEESV
ncbi:MAG: AAA family ATPase [Nanoarchaeota archaeon]